MIAIYAMLLFNIMIDMAIHSYAITSNQIIVHADFARPIKICFLHPCESPVHPQNLIHEIYHGEITLKIFLPRKLPTIRYTHMYLPL